MNIEGSAYQSDKAIDILKSKVNDAFPVVDYFYNRYLDANSTASIPYGKDGLDIRSIHNRIGLITLSAVVGPDNSETAATFGLEDVSFPAIIVFSNWNHSRMSTTIIDHGGQFYNASVNAAHDYGISLDGKFKRMSGKTIPISDDNWNPYEIYIDSDGKVAARQVVS